MEQQSISCPECGQVVHITDEGYIRPHFNSGGYRCSMSGEQVEVIRKRPTRPEDIGPNELGS